MPHLCCCLVATALAVIRVIRHLQQPAVFQPRHHLKIARHSPVRWSMTRHTRIHQRPASSQFTTTAPFRYPRARSSRSKGGVTLECPQIGKDFGWEA